MAHHNPFCHNKRQIFARDWEYNGRKMMKTLRSFLRVFFGLIIISISLAGIMAIGVWLYFNPNDYKQEITTFITQKSGLPLEIHGTIEMKYFPWLGFTVHDVSLAQAPSFGQTPFIQIDSLAFKMPVRELLKRQLRVQSLSVNGLNVRLIKNDAGKTNWDYYTNKFKQTTTAPHPFTVKVSQEASRKKQKKLDFKLIDFTLNQANLSFEDKTKSEILKINDFSLKGQAEKSFFPVKGQLKLTQQHTQTQQIYLSGQGAFDGALSNLGASIDTTLLLNFAQNPYLQSITVNTHADINTTGIALKNLQVQVKDQLLTGNASIPLDANKAITFKLNMKQFNLDTLQNKVQSTSNSMPDPVKKPLPHPSSATQTPARKAPMRSFNGEIYLDKLISQNITLTAVKANVKIDNAQLKVSPLTASLYQGKLSLVLTQDLAPKQSPLRLQGDLINVQIQPLLKDYQKEQRLSGTANINFNLAQNDLLQGEVKVNLSDGVIDGVDVRYYLSVAQSLFKKEKSTVADTQKTPFGNLSATLKIHDNMIDNNDLIIQGTDFNAKGEGSVYLGSQTIAYKLQAWQHDKANPNAYPLAIRIKGSLQHPRIKPDMDVYIKKGLEQQLKKQLDNQIEKNLGKLLGNDPAHQNADQASVQDELQQKIEKKLNKGLKKLFKKKE